MAKNIQKEINKDLFLLISNLILDKLIDRTPARTGNMKRSWELVQLEPFVYEISNTAEYAEYVDSGTGIYATEGVKNKYKPVTGAKEIRPKEKKAMKFKIGGHTFFVKKIKGQKPRKIMEILLSKKLEKELEEGFKKILDKYMFN